MGKPPRRSFPRTFYDAPIRYAPMNDDRYAESRALNFSRDGMYFEPEAPLNVETNVRILMMNYSPGTFGPEAYRAYDAEVRWCRDISSNGIPKFGVGVRFLAKNHEVQGLDQNESHFPCSLCGKLLNKTEMNEPRAHVYLCPNCRTHYDAFPDGPIKCSIERFMLGNVI